MILVSKNTKYMRVFEWVPEGKAVEGKFGREDRIFLILLAYLPMTSAAPACRLAAGQSLCARPVCLLPSRLLLRIKSKSIAFYCHIRSNAKFVTVTLQVLYMKLIIYHVKHMDLQIACADNVSQIEILKQ